jgi:hypothetical protein
MGKSNIQQVFDYKRPVPFALPVVEGRRENQFTGSLAFLNAQLPVTQFPREGLEFSSDILEEIMFNITAEARERNNTLPRWRKYKTSDGGDITFDEFEDPQKDGSNLSGQPVEFFPLIVRDIQNEIENLVEQAGFEDSLDKYFARIFANNTITNPGFQWNGNTKLTDGVRINTITGQQSVNLLANAKAGRWPVAATFVAGIVPTLGVRTTDPTVQQANIQGGAGTIEVTDPNFPQSPYGATTASGIPGVATNLRMTAGNRTVYNRINTDNSSLGVGAGLEDPDMGYGYLASVGHMVEQLRYQPPVIETFPNNIAVRDYASNLFSNTTPNLPWVLSLPVETEIFQNWGFWLIKGQVGVQNNQAFLRAYNNPSASVGGQGECPFAVFFPPPTANCGCSTGDSAYFIWHASGTNLVWNDMLLFQGRRASLKFFGRNTRLVIDATVSGGAAGTQINNAFFGVGIRTARISNVNLQPFYYIIAKDLQEPTSVTTSVPGNNTGFSVNIMENMNQILGNQYPIGGRDAILALQILVQVQSRANWTCDAVDGPTGRFLPDSCANIEKCSAGSMTALVDSIRLEEPAINGDPVNNYK